MVLKGKVPNMKNQRQGKEIVGLEKAPLLKTSGKLQRNNSVTIEHVLQQELVVYLKAACAVYRKKSKLDAKLPGKVLVLYDRVKKVAQGKSRKLMEFGILLVLYSFAIAHHTSSLVAFGDASFMRVFLVLLAEKCTSCCCDSLPLKSKDEIIRQIVDVSDRNRAVDCIQDIQVMVDGGKFQYIALCEQLYKEGNGQFVVPLGFDTMIAMLQDGSLEHDKVLVHRGGMQYAEAMKMMVEDKHDANYVLKQFRHTFDSQYLNNDKDIEMATSVSSDVFQSIFQFHKIEFSTCGVENRMTIQKQQDCSSTIEIWKNAYLQKRYDCLADAAISDVVQCHFSIRILLSLSQNIPQSHITQRSEFVKCGGLETLLTVARYNASPHVCEQVSTQKLLSHDIALHKSLYYTIKLTPALARIGLAMFSKVEYKKYRSYCAIGGTFELVDALILEQEKMEASKNKQKQLRQNLKKQSKDSSTALDKRLSACRQYRTIAKNYVSRSTCREILPGKMLRIEEIYFQVSKSVAEIRMRCARTGTDYMTWTAMKLTHAEKHELELIANENMIKEKQRQIKARNHRVLEEKREAVELVYMQLHDKYSESEAARRQRLELNKLEDALRVELRKKDRYKVELRRLQQIEQIEQENRENELMRQQDTLFLQRIAKRKHANDSKTYMDEARRIYLLKMQDIESARVASELSQLAFEDTLTRNIRYREQCILRERLERETFVARQEIKLMIAEEKYCQTIWPKIDAEIERIEQQRIRVEKRQQRHLARQREKLVDKIALEDSTWEEYVDEDGQVAFYNSLTADCVHIIPDSQLKKELRIFDGTATEDDLRIPDANDPWQLVNVDGNAYYENIETGETSWTKPETKVSEIEIWHERIDMEGNTYYESSTTGEISWTPKVKVDLPPCWIECSSNEGVYYYNTETQESCWEFPS